MDISGKYKTQHGEVTICQEGERISATYGENGTCNGIIKNNIVEGTWLNNGSEGLFKWFFEENRKFTGKYKKGLDAGIMRGSWDGDLINLENKSSEPQKINYESGDTYFGFLKNEKRHGIGKFTWANGKIYDGDWVNGKQHGKGIMKYASGNIYEGEWKDDEMNGKGKYTFASGNVYEGDFLNGKRTGRGIYTFSDGDIYEGDWKDGKYHGKGKFTWTDGDIYEGEWKDDEMNGKGKYTFANGNVYEGDFLNGKRTGRGKFTWTDGDIYEGEWKDDEMNGKGKYTFANGNIYEGDWVKGKRHGKGKMKYASGDVYEGEWKEGKRLGYTKFEQAEAKKEEKINIQKEITRERWFKIKYKIKLKSAKHMEVSRGSIMGTIFGYDKIRQEKIVSKDKGEKIERIIQVKYPGQTIPEGKAKKFVEDKDYDVKKGNAGSSTIEIISIKLVN